MTPERVTVAACQLLTGEEVAENARKAASMMEGCAERGVEIVAFPEGCLFGYCCREDYWESISHVAFKEAEAQIAEACRRLNLAAVIGSAQRVEGAWHNDLAIFDERGVLRHRYAKTFLAGEKWCVNNRGKLPVVTLRGVDCCFIICHDVRYPELVRLPAAMGAKICFFCSCESGLLSEYKLSAYRAMPISRATENGVFLVMANTPANPSDLRAGGQSHGNSKIVHPDGNVLNEAGHFGDAIIAETLDLSAATGALPRRAHNDDTAIREWFQQGTQLVTRIGE